MTGELQQGGIEADRLPLSLEDGALQPIFNIPYAYFELSGQGSIVSR